MKPDQHKKKRSAQYKRKYATAQKKEKEGTNTTQAKTTSSSATSSTSAAGSVNPQRSKRLPSQTQHSLQNTKDFTTDESETVRYFSRRKIESNWDRYEPLDGPQDDVGSSDGGLRGADFKTLLTQTGDASSQFRFKDEQIWEEDEVGVGKDQDSEGFPSIDCHALSHQLMAIPLHVRLNIEDSFFESSLLQTLNEIALRHKKEFDSAQKDFLSANRDTSSSMVFTTGNKFINTPRDEDTTVDVHTSQDAECPKMTGNCIQVKDTLDPEDLPIQGHSIEHMELCENSRAQDSSHMGESETVTVTNNVELNSESNSTTNTTCLSSDLQTSKTSAVMRTAKQVQTKSSDIKPSLAMKEPKQSQSKLPQACSEPDSKMSEMEDEDELDSAVMRTAKQVETKSSDIKPSLAMKEPKQSQSKLPQACSEPDSKMSEMEDEDELDFLLSLENPIQTRSKPADSSVDQEGQESTPSLPQETAVKITSVPTPVEASPQNGSRTDSLEDWLDSVLDD